MRLGDEMNGFLAEEILGSVAEIVPWLREASAHFFPKFRSQGTRRKSPVPAPENLRVSHLPTLRGTSCGPTWHG